MRSRPLWLVFGSVLVALALVGCGAKKEEGPLLRMLRFVPDVAEYRQWVSYGDAAAWHESWGIPRADSMAELEEWDREPRAYWTRIMFQQTVPGEALGFTYLKEDQRGFYGFDIFNLDRYLEAGRPPKLVTIAEFGFDRGQIAGALTASGYAAQALDVGGTLYSVREDYEVDVASPSDSNRMGRRNRIALLEKQLVLGSATELVTGSLAAHADQRDSLAGNPAFRAVAAALEKKPLAEYGELMGVLFMDGGQFADVDACAWAVNASLAAYEECSQEWESQPDLDRYDLVVVITQHTTGASYVTLALVFPAGVDAPAAAQILRERIENYTRLSDGRPLRDVWAERSIAVETAASVEAQGHSLALLVVRSPDPPPTPDSEPIVLSYVWSWLDMIYARDMGFLSTW